MSGPLDGRRIALTQPERGRIDDAVVAAGADVVHVPLIFFAPPTDGGAALAAVAERLDDFDWLVVASATAAEAIAAVATLPPALRVAAVGAATAGRLAECTGRTADFIPTVARRRALVAEFPVESGSVLVLASSRSPDELPVGLRRRGLTVEVVEAYRTDLRTPSSGELAAIVECDAMLLASSSAVESWAACDAAPGPPVVAIGPSTAATAAERGIDIAATAASPSPSDVVAAIAVAIG